MNNITGLAVFALGIVLLIFGFNASQPFGAELSRNLSNNSDQSSVWLIAGGGAAVLGGLFLALRSRRA
jgi:LPXTG-motif cell wall-anchored protein